MKKNDRIMEAVAVGIIFVLTLLFFYIACTTKVKAVAGGIGPMDFPKIILGIQLLLLLITVFHMTAGIRKSEKMPLKEEKASKEPLVDKRVALSIAAILIYIICWNFLGFCLSSFLFFSYEAHLLDKEDKLWKILVLGLVATTLIYLVFGIGFKVSFPEPLAEILLQR